MIEEKDRVVRKMVSTLVGMSLLFTGCLGSGNSRLAAADSESGEEEGSDSDLAEAENEPSKGNATGNKNGNNRPQSTDVLQGEQESSDTAETSDESNRSVKVTVKNKTKSDCEVVSKEGGFFNPDSAFTKIASGSSEEITAQLYGEEEPIALFHVRCKEGNLGAIGDLKVTPGKPAIWELNQEALEEWEGDLFTYYKGPSEKKAISN